MKPINTCRSIIVSLKFTMVVYNFYRTTLYIPVIAFLSVSLFIGTFGNLLVIIIYTYRQKKSSSDYFILCLSFLDLITCFAGIPLEITDLCLSYTFYLAIVCKLRAIEYWTTSSAALLVVISIDRYKRICQYGKKIRNKTAKMLCFMSLLIGGLLSWPAAIILGTKTVDLQIPRLCSLGRNEEERLRSHLLYRRPTLFHYLCGFSNSCIRKNFIVYRES